MSIFIVFVCFTSAEGQAPQCHPAYPRQYASAEECEAFSKNDSFLRNYIKGVRDGQYQRGISVEVLCKEKSVPASEPSRRWRYPVRSVSNLGKAENESGMSGKRSNVSIANALVSVARIVFAGLSFSA